MGARGRKLKLTEEKLKQITGYLAGGNSITTVLDIVGIGRTTYYNWIKIGEEEQERVNENPRSKVRKDKEIFVRLITETKKAEAAAKAERIRRISQAGKDGDWKADAWYLERRYPEEFALRQRMEHSGGLNNTNANINIELDYLDDDQLEEELAKIREANGDD